MNKLKKYLRRQLGFSYRFIRGIKTNNQPKFSLSKDWLNLISLSNRDQLVYPWISNNHQFFNMNKPKVEIDYFSWKIAFNALGALYSYITTGNQADIRALQTFFDNNIDPIGNWKTPINRVDSGMKGYTLLYFRQLNTEKRYNIAADKLADEIINKHPRSKNNSFYYDFSSEAILVDTLGMICPFLARYARIRKNQDALDLSTVQILQFIENNLDPETNLPYHGYYENGPKRLGLHGWGRGTGWYMMGLIDTILELDDSQPDRNVFTIAYQETAKSLRKFQREDGHWNWAIPHRRDSFDSSTTSMIGYSLIRGYQQGLLDDSYRNPIKKAVNALLNTTRGNGLIDQSSGECRGLGKYPQVYGPTPWVQGSATAFISIFFEIESKF